MKKSGLILLIALVFWFSSCVHIVKKQTLVQVSTIDALLQGVFDGQTTLGELATNGNFGIGTFNSLDGEMVLEDGHFYQVRADGKVYQPGLETKTPFASVVAFDPEKSMAVSNLDFEGLKLLIDSIMTGGNYFYAIRLEGEFTHVKTRSVPAQKKPYPPLIEVTKNQPEFDLLETKGTMTGFYCPAFVKGINVVGYHLHYLSDDHEKGGHLLEFEMKEGILKLDRISEFSLKLPMDEDFQGSEFDTDRSKELKKVEG